MILPRWTDHPVITDYLERVYTNRDMHRMFFELFDGELSTHVLGRLYNLESEPARLRKVVNELYGNKASITNLRWKEIVHQAHVLRLQESLDDQDDALRKEDFPAAIEATERLRKESPTVLRTSWNSVLSMLASAASGHRYDEKNIDLLTESLYRHAYKILHDTNVENLMEDYPKKFPPHHLPVRKLDFDDVWKGNDSSRTIYAHLLGMGVPPLVCTAITMAAIYNRNFGKEFFGYLHAVLPPDATKELEGVVTTVAGDDASFLEGIIEESLDLHRDRASTAFFCHVDQREVADARRELLTLKELAQGHAKLAEGWQMIIDMFDELDVDKFRDPDNSQVRRFYVLFDRLLEFQSGHPNVIGKLVLDEE